MPKKKRFSIRKEDISAYGSMPGCPGCTAIKEGRRAVHHWERCRARVMQEMRDQGENAAAGPIPNATDQGDIEMETEMIKAMVLMKIDIMEMYSPKQWT